MKKLKYDSKNVIINLKVLRAIEVNEKDCDAAENININEIMLQMWNRICAINSKSVLTYFVETIKFIFLLFVTIIASSADIVKYLGMFTIKFIDSCSQLIHILTPIFLSIIELISKICGGFFLIIAMIWKDSVGKKTQTQTLAIRGGGDGSQKRDSHPSLKYNNYY